MKLPQSPFKFILYFVRKQRFKFSCFILIAMVWAFNDAIFPYFLKRIVDTLHGYQGDPSHVFSAVKGTLFLLMLAWILAEIFQRTQGFIQVYALPEFRANIREAVFNYVKSHSHEYFSSHFAGNLAKKLADLPTSCQTIVEIFCYQFVTATMGSLIVLIMMWSVNPIFAVIVFVWLCIHLGLTILLMHKNDKLWEQHSDSVSTLSGKIVDAFTNMLNVRLFARGHYESLYLKKFQDDEIKKARKAMFLMEWTRIALGINGLFLIFGTVFALLYGYAHQWVSLGDFTQIGMQTFWLLGWIWHLSYQLNIFTREVGTIRNALSLIKRGHDIIDIANAKTITIRKGEIQIEHISFAYNKNRPVFKDLTITIPGGQKVGLVGFSGSGKSTLVNLLLRFYDLTSGKILIDGQDIATIIQDSLREQIAMIPQDPSLFHRSLMENIRYGRPDASDAEVIQASKLAHCHEFIEKLDEGYESLVGERGIKLSGGQRQRIAIARAILKNAPILILDEATSSLDSVTEKMIQESLHTLMKGRTTLVIAHRLSTLADMDRILVFDKGHIVETGTQKELLALQGHFAKLWNMQSDGFLPNE